jgi:uncharacterized protein (DUF58 family)
MEEEDLLIYILLDSSRSMDFGYPHKHEFAKHLTAALAYIGTSNLDRIKILSFTESLEDQLPTTRSKSKLYQVLQFLQNLHPAGNPTHLAQMVDHFLIKHKKPGVCILLSDFLDPEGFETPLKKLLYNHFEPMVIQILAPEELQPTLLGDLQLIDAETQQALDLSMNRRALQQYQETLELFCKSLEDFCTQRNINFIRAITSIPFEEIVLKHLRKAQVLS